MRLRRRHYYRLAHRGVLQVGQEGAGARCWQGVAALSVRFTLFPLGRILDDWDCFRVAHSSPGYVSQTQPFLKRTDSPSTNSRYCKLYIFFRYFFNEKVCHKEMCLIRFGLLGRVGNLEGRSLLVRKL